VGLPPHSRGTGQAGYHRGVVHGLADPQECWHRASAPPGRPGLGGVPAIVGAGDPGAGHLHRRPAQWYEGLRPGRDRTWHPPDPGGGATENPVQSCRDGPVAHGDGAVPVAVPGCGLHVAGKTVVDRSCNWLRWRSDRKMRRPDATHERDWEARLRPHFLAVVLMNINLCRKAPVTYAYCICTLVAPLYPSCWL